jgi:hypothetical protein
MSRSGKQRLAGTLQFSAQSREDWEQFMNRTSFLKLAVLALLPGLEAAGVSVTNPRLSGPISGGDQGVAFGALPAEDLTPTGYSQAEYFSSGTATAYENVGPLGD